MDEGKIFTMKYLFHKFLRNWEKGITLFVNINIFLDDFLRETVIFRSSLQSHDLGNMVLTYLHKIGQCFEYGILIYFAENSLSSLSFLTYCIILLIHKKFSLLHPKEIQWILNFSCAPNNNVTVRWKLFSQIKFEMEHASFRSSKSTTWELMIIIIWFYCYQNA